MAAVLGSTALLVVVTASPAAADLVVTVDPSTGLADGQPVTVSGTGFAPNTSIGAAQCSAASTQSRSTEDCDLSTSRTGNADGNGAGSFVLRAKRTITTSHETVDCASAAGACLFAMAELSDLTVSSGMVVSFDPNAPPLPPPDVSVSPDTGLVDHQQVAVVASGFIPGEFVQISQCGATDTEVCQNGQFGGGGGQADPNGTVVFGLPVRRAVLVDGNRLDCASAAGACVVIARASGGPTGSAPLAFDGSVPLPPLPTVTVTPSTGLADRQIVTVTGKDFSPSGFVVLTQCEKGAQLNNGGCSSSTYRAVNADSHGAFSVTMLLRRTIDTYDPQTGEESDLDCATAPGTCEVNALDELDFTLTANTPLDFDPNAPPLPGPAGTATPSTGLVDGQSVDVTAEGMPPGAGIFVVQCKAGANDANNCDLSNLQSVTADDAGHLTTTYTVKRVLSLFSGVVPPPVGEQPVTGRAPKSAASFQPQADPSGPTPFDCASAPGACVINVTFFGPTVEAATIPLSFDPSVPATTTTSAGGPTPVPGEPATTVPGTSGPATSAAAAAAPSSTSGSGSTQPLPVTGAPIMPLLRRVAVLLAVGFTLVLAARLRRRRLSMRHLAR
jgi:hypothetical protein